MYKLELKCGNTVLFTPNKDKENTFIGYIGDTYKGVFSSRKLKNGSIQIFYKNQFNNVIR